MLKFQKVTPELKIENVELKSWNPSTLILPCSNSENSY